MKKAKLFKNPIIKFFTKIIIFVSLFLIVATTFKHCAFAFENEFEFPDKINNLIQDTRSIKTVVTYKIVDSETTEDLEGIAINLGKGYFLALTHVFEHAGYIEIPFGYAGFRQNVEIISYQYSIDNHNAELIGKYDDISLFKVQNYPKESFVRFGDSDLLRFGDKLILIGNTGMKGINLKTGIASRFDLSYESFKNEAWCSFIVSNPTNGGDSGGMLLAQDGEDYYIVGIIHSYLMKTQGMGIAFKSNYVKGVLKLITQDIKFLE